MRAILLVLFAVCAAMALAESIIVSSEVTSHAERDEARNYWTRDRMMSAIPKDVVLEGEPTELDTDLLDEINEGAGGESVGHDSVLFGEGEIDQGERDADDGELSHSKRLLGSYATSASYTTYPWRTVGKVFFTIGGVNYVCSGAVLGTYLVATAGHCVFDNGQWATQWTFVPGYNNNIRPYGTFTSYQLFAPTGWAANAKYCKDYGFAVMKKLNGNPIGNVVGVLGYKYAASYTQTWRSLGYPAASPFNGQLNYYINSGQAGTDVPGGCAPATSSINTDATPSGASGGPWVLAFGTSNFLNGVNSYTYATIPNRMFGPYFDTAWFNAMTAANAVVPP